MSAPPEPDPPEPATEAATEGDAAEEAAADAPERGIADLLGELFALAAQPGGTGRRLDAERDALAGLDGRFARATVRGQQVYGGDHIVVNVGTGGTGPNGVGPVPGRVVPLPEAELDEARAAFVRPGGYAALLGELAGRHLMLLRGPDGAGKYATARALLLAAGHARLFRVDPGADLARLGLGGDDGGFAPGAGYVLPDLPDAAGLTAFERQRLATALAARDCRLVITLSPGLALPDPEAGREIVDLGPPPPGPEVVRAQLAWRLGPAGAARTRRLLERADVRRLIAADLGPEGEWPRLATVAAFAAEPGAENSAALSAAMSGMLNSLVASGRTQQLQVPEEVQGYRSVPLDHIDP